MAGTSSADHARRAKWGFLVGLGLFLIGGVGGLVGHTVLGGIPTWEATLLFDLEVIGLLVGFFSPIVFGIAIPLLD